MKNYLKECKEISENIKDIISVPIIKIMVVGGVVLIFLSFINFKGIRDVSISCIPHWVMLQVGFILILLGLLTERISYKRIKIGNGVAIKLGQAMVNIKIGEIQKIQALSEAAAVVLPANTSFTDDCIIDKDSALGAFMLEYFPGKIHEIIRAIADTIKTLRLPQDKDGAYPPGTTIMLPQPYSNTFNIMITASTYRKTKEGIKAEPTNICECIKQIFMNTSDKKISKLYMPILGSGHGGLEINCALFLLLLAIKFYAKQYHHIKSVDIIITNKDVQRLKDLPCLNFLQEVER